MAGEVAGGDGAAYVQRLGGPGEELLVGVGGDRGVEVDRVGEVEVALDVHGPGGGDLVEVDVETAGVGGGGAFGFGLVGVEPGDRFLDEPASWVGPILCATWETWASTNAAAAGERDMVRSAMKASFHAGSRPVSSCFQQRVSR